jgi:hypothetical protein
MPTGQRKASLAKRINVLLNLFFGGQALAFTGEAAVAYADIMTTRERLGLSVEPADAQIAAICRLHGADLATRNVRDFTETGVRVIDPWED